MTPHELTHDAKHNYTCIAEGHEKEACAGKVFKSVTTILGTAVPKNLGWHGQTRGVIGVKGLMRLAKYNVTKMKPGEVATAFEREGISTGPHPDAPAGRAKLSAIPKYDIVRMTADQITEALKREHLTVNDHRDEAAAGGTVVHKALEEYITKGLLPVASQVPESKRRSIEGLAKFILDYRPEFIAAEVRTLSTEHGYAGTFDFLARIHAELYTVPKRGGGEYLKLRPSESVLFVLGDMKNSKYVYPTSHFAQLEGYEGARLEVGEPPTDVRVVLWLNADGHMELVPSTFTFADFLTLKASAEVISRGDKAWQRPKKVRP
jgi:hypothetical protein